MSLEAGKGEQKGAYPLVLNEGIANQSLALDPPILTMFVQNGCIHLEDRLTQFLNAKGESGGPDGELRMIILGSIGNLES